MAAQAPALLAQASAAAPPVPTLEEALAGVLRVNKKIWLSYKPVLTAYNHAAASAGILARREFTSWADARRHLKVVMAFAQRCATAKGLDVQVVVRLKALARELSSTAADIRRAIAESMDSGIPMALTKKQEDELLTVERACEDIEKLRRAIKSAHNAADDYFSSYADIFKAMTIIFGRLEDAASKEAAALASAAATAGTAAAAAKPPRFLELHIAEGAADTDDVFCPRKAPLPRALATIATAVMVRMPEDVVLSVVGMLGERGDELCDMMAGLHFTVTQYRDDPAAAMQDAADDAVEEGIRKQLTSTAADELDSTGLNLQSAWCAFTMATPPLEAMDFIKLKIRPPGKPEFVMDPDRSIDLKVYVFGDGHDGQTTTVALPSLDPLNRAFEGGLNAHYRDAAELALGLTAVRKGYISMNSGEITSISDTPPPTPLPPVTDAAAAASGSTSGVDTRRTISSSGGGASGSSNGEGAHDTCSSSGGGASGSSSGGGASGSSSGGGASGSSSGGGASGSSSGGGGSSVGETLAMLVPNVDDPTLAAEIMPVGQKSVADA